MAKMKLSESSFSLIPEGITTVKIMAVDDSKYEDFGILVVKMQTAKGETHSERFSLMKENGEVNEGALKAWSYFARVCLNNSRLEEIDTQDIVGCYITATVKHETYTKTKGDNAGKTGTSVRLNDYVSAVGFGGSEAAGASEDDLGDSDDLDDLDDL